MDSASFVRRDKRQTGGVGRGWWRCFACTVTLPVFCSDRFPDQHFGLHGEEGRAGCGVGKLAYPSLLFSEFALVCFGSPAADGDRWGTGDSALVFGLGRVGRWVAGGGITGFGGSLFNIVAWIWVWFVYRTVVHVGYGGRV